MGGFQTEGGQYHGFYEGGYEELFKGFSAGVLTTGRACLKSLSITPALKDIGELISAYLWKRRQIRQMPIKLWDVQQSPIVPYPNGMISMKHRMCAAMWLSEGTAGHGIRQPVCTKRQTCQRKKATGPLPSGDANGCRPV